jgi:peroxiredoxin
MPNVTLPDLDGRPVRLADFHGKRVLLFFWASW